MFKVESYITPFIVSYVDKYVKNIKPEDSRVSLWGGDAVFHNLDLKLDVLEEELHSPFTFSSGHIHELRIHVPWTKLASEPIVITINTIECTLKLKNHEDRLSQRSGHSQQKGRGRKQEIVGSPPGYIQSLLSKIVNNISIVCNNVILKYLEEDIVLSLNAKTVAITSVDSKWDPAFIELAAPDLTLRKQITVTDLTICLDQCNAMGKIPIYQEPLLYRSSFKIRMSSTYPNFKGIRASRVRIDWMFSKLDFSLSDQQIPMFMRLFNLMLALYLGEFKSKTDAEQGDDASVTPTDADNPEENENTQSWAGWAWSYVPSILPIYPDDETDVKDIPSERERVVNMGVYIERVNWTIKWTERDGPVSAGTKRMRFLPFLTVRMQGCFLEVTLGGVEWVDVQGGISHFTLEPSSTTCLCGASEEGSLYYLQGCERSAFLNSSLYDPDGKPSAELPDSIFHWDRHINRVTEATLLERTPALAFDYVYQLELPQENASEYLSQLGSELEYSNLQERALLRLAVGPFQLKISYGLCHRLSAIHYATNQYNYPDYINNSQHAYHRQRSTQENSVNQMLAMAGNIPKRTYQAAVLRPLVFVSLSPVHPPFDLQRLVEKRIIRQRVVDPPVRSSAIPVLKISCTCADFRLVRPMYPLRLTFTLQANPSSGLAQHNNSEMRLKLHDLSTELVTEECQMVLLRPSSSTLLIQSILLPELWEDHIQQVLFRLTLETKAMDWSFTRAQFDYVGAMWRSLTNPADPLLAVPPNSLAMASLRVNEDIALQFSFKDIRVDYSNTIALLCFGVRVGSFNLSVARPDTEPKSVFTSLISNDGRPFIDSLFQIPSSLVTPDIEYVDSKGVPVAFLKVGTYSATLHPDLFTWFELISNIQQEGADVRRLENNRGRSIERMTSHASNQSICARDSGLSSSFEGQTWREAPSSVVLSHSTPSKPSPPAKQAGQKPVHWLAYRRLLQRSLLHIDVLRGVLVTYGKSGSKELRFKLPSIYVSCPHLPSEALTIRDLPFRPAESANSSFPWTVNCQDLSLESKSGTILEPVSLKMTIALNPSSTKTEPSIDLCIHVDMNAIQVKMTEKQVSLVCEQAADLLQFVGSLSSVSSAATAEETHFELGLWLQWAMPRFLLSLETAEARAVLDMEDVTTSVDYQHRRFAKIKSRLTSICAKLFVINEDRWVLEPATNGIVLSCSDDVTRDLWTQLDVVPSRAEPATPIEVGTDQGDVPLAASDGVPDTYSVHQDPKPLPKVANSSTGGVMTVTWTRAHRKDVYSKWNGNTPNQTEEKSNETTNTDTYLQEMDVCLEAIDLVLTEKLIELFSQLTSSVRPALDRAFDASVDQSSLPMSSHSLPLMFANSKGFRVFLADESFILLNIDRIELSPRIQNPIDRCVVLRADLFGDAEHSGLINTPGNDVEDRQYQLDVTGISVSSGQWSEIAKASWIKKTLNPASVLHTMVENPALEWNARNQASEEALIAMKPIVARASLKTVFAPPIVSLEQQCLVAGQAVEISASSDLRLFIDLGQLEQFERWIALLSKPSQSPQSDTTSHPSHTFITCNKISMVVYEHLPKEDSASFVPYASVLLIQPHILMKNIQEQQEATVEWSVYDARIQLPCWAGEAPVRSYTLPDEALFPISLIKTLPGEPNAETGVPPSLLSIRQLLTRQSSLDIGRPVKLFLHDDSVRLAQFLARRYAARERGQADDVPSESNINELSVTTSQILVELPLVAGVVTAGWNEVTLDVSHWNSARLAASAICVQIAAAEELHQMCDPFSLECRVRLVSAAWSEPKIQLTRVSCQADNLRLHIGPRQIKVINCLVQLINDGFYTAGFPSNPGTSEREIITIEKDRQFLDDLRTGAFDFQVRDSCQLGDSGTPKPYQVVFNVQPPSMTWTYPQPRALTRVEIYPIPLLKADESGTGSEHVDCSLEYWDDCAEQFRVLRKFSLSETRFTRVPLPSVAGREQVEHGLSQDEPVFSNNWRIVMNFSEENLPENRPKKIIAAPPSLVACTKVDSYFSASSVPLFQVHCTFNHASLALHYQHRHDANRKVDGFLFDGAVPGDFPFATVSLSSTSVAVRNSQGFNENSKKNWLELSTQLQINVTDFESLVDEPLLEPTGFDLKVASEGDEILKIFLANRDSFDINLSQRTVRTLSASLASYEDDTEGDVLFADYIIRNDTQQVLRVGQFGSGESVLLASRAAHQYAWKSIANENKKLQACMEGSRWRWCQPIRPDKVGTFVRAVVDSRPIMPLIWTIKSIGPVQKEVTVRGQVQVGNLFQFPLEVKLVPVGSSGGSSNVVLSEIRAIVPASSLAPSFVFPLEHLQAVKVRFPGSAWSGAIPLVQHSTDHKPRNVLLVRIVPKDKDDVLNLWCHLLTEKIDQQYSRLLVILSPLYVVRSYLPLPLRLHLRTPGLSLSHYCEIEGRGQLSVLQCPGTVDHSHMISFQLSSHLPESTPAVPLSWTMVPQYANHSSSQQPDLGSSSLPFIDELIDELFSKQAAYDIHWPFTGDEIQVTAAEAPQLKTDVRVAFSTLHRRCHALLVELKPWALLVNRSGSDLVVKRNDEASWPLPSGATAAPPPLNDGTFRIGLKTSDDGPVFYSQPLLLQDSEHFHFMSYRPRVDGAIPLEGYCFVRVPIKEDKIAFLTVSSKSHEGIRILLIEPTIRVRNDLNCQLDIGSFVGGKDTLRSDKVAWNTTRTSGGSSAILIWSVSSANIDYSNLYLSTRLCSQWSCPIRMAHPGARQTANSINPQRHSVSVPLSTKCTSSNEPAVNCPLNIHRFEQSGCAYLTVAFDACPSLILINRTKHSLLYAQASDDDPGTAEQDCEGVAWHGVVRPETVAHYTPPWNQERFLDVSPPNSLPRLIFALPPDEGSDPLWSQAVHPSHAYDQFLNIASRFDVMVRIERSGVANQTAVYIESVTNHQISASDIRGRIAPSSDSLDKEPLPPNSQLKTDLQDNHENCCLEEATDVVCTPSHIHAASLLPANTSSWDVLKRLSICLYWPEIGFCLRDDTATPRREIARLTLDHLLVKTQPGDEMKQDVSIFFGHVQLDNQLCRSVKEAYENDDAYDFPVVLCAQNSPTWTPNNYSLIQEKAMVNLQLTFIPGSLSAIRIRVEPVFLFLEDCFIAVIGDYLQSVIISLAQIEAKIPIDNAAVPFPEKIADVLSSASMLINLDRLVVDTVDLDLSLRSSLKLYIALDHSPLRLSLFERTHISTMPYKLGQSLAMHYVSSALFKAGWVVGSLELLGSPTALARTVTIGLKDFVRLPYQGIWMGPRGFLAGILNGSASLVSHVTAGTVTSVTQLASSVARNVDRLSFDSDYQQRSEEGRRKKPQGLVQGISWGMGALGLSLLGALGGLAHHPLQSIMEDGTVSPRNLAVGLTKGIVGVVAKPISGAADLVAQTGQGLLSATQWREPFQTRRPQGPLSGGLINSSLEMICSGSTKILWKITDEAPAMSFSGRGQDARANRICCCMEAMRARVNEALPIREQLAPVLLVISTQNFCVLNAEDGEVQVVLDLNEVDCWAHDSDPTLIRVRPTPLSLSSAFAEARRDEEISPTFDYERVSEFVRLTTPFVLPESSKSPDGARHTPCSSSSLITMEFFVNPAWKAFFIQCFKLAKRQRKGHGFTLI